VNLTQLADARILRDEWAANLLRHVQRLHELFGYEGARNSTRFYGLGPIGPTCLSLESYGSGDEEKHVCGFQSLSHGDCVVISIGGKNLWAFEKDLLFYTNCIVHVFDCTVELEVPKTLQHRVFAHDLCLAGKARGKFVTWDLLLKKLHLKSYPKYLKMDIEGYEWEALPQMLIAHRTEHTFLPEQISFELHYAMNNRTQTIAELAIFMDLLYRDGGYMIMDVRLNPHCYHCIEVLVGRLAACCPQ